MDNSSATRDGGWSDERVALLKKLWDSGLSASQVAKQMGGVTRNGVIGKVYRLRLARPKIVAIEANTRAQRIRREAERMAKPKAPPKVKPIPPRQVAPKLSIVPLPEVAPAYGEGEGVSLLDLTLTSCRFPLGPALAKAERYCGAPHRTGSPYCAHHHAICYTPAPKRVKKRPVAVRGFNFAVAAE